MSSSTAATITGSASNLAQGDPLSASVEFYRRIFADLGIHGRVGVYGHLDQGYAYTFLTALNAALADVEIVGRNRHKPDHANPGDQRS